MSNEALGWVFAHSPMKGVAFTVHLAVADVVNDEFGNEFFGSVGRLAKKARCGRDAARRAMRSLEDHDPPLLERLTHTEDQLPVPITEPIRYRFLMPTTPRVTDATPPRHKSGVPRATDATPPASQTRLSQKGSQGGSQGDSLPGLDPPPDEPPTGPTMGQRANAITRAVYDTRTPKPAAPFIAAAKLVARFLELGHSDTAVEHALRCAPTISIGAIEFQLSRQRPPAAQRIDSDRGGLDGRLHL